MTLWLPFLVAFVVSVIAVPIVREVSLRVGGVADPRADRWHKRPTPIFGGVGIFTGFAVAVLVGGGGNPLHWGLLLGAVLMFGLGLYDDIRPLKPHIKMAGQILGAAIVVFSGYTTNFFGSELLNVLITVIWLVGITNAINLLDNMDGLAGGISFIVTLFLNYFFWSGGGNDAQLLMLSLALSGGILGFLVYNFPPASIFMGDSGSLFLGFTMAALAIARGPQASNVFAVMGVPTLLFLLPILDTTLVTLTRLLRGQSPAQGGRDHTSHRLVAFGLTERQAVFVLYGIALASGVAAAGLESLDYNLSLVLIPILIIGFALLAAYLGRLKVVETQKPRESVFSNVMLELTYRRRMFEIALDFFLISIAYYMAFWTRFGFSLEADGMTLFLQSLPTAVGGAYLAFFLMGVYRGVWRYFGVDDLLRFARAVVVVAVLVGGALWWWFGSAVFSPVTLFLFAIFLFIALASSRSSFRVLDRLYSEQAHRDATDVRVLIYGAGDMGEMALRWILRNPDLGYRVMGLIDDDPYMTGRSIHGVKVLGSSEQLEELLAANKVEGLIITTAVMANGEKSQLALEIARQYPVWVRKVELGFELIS